VGDRIAVLQAGLGALGRKLTPYLLERPRLEIVGAVDPDPELAGRDLGEVAGLERKLGIGISADLDGVPAAEAAVVTTVSDLAASLPLMRALIARGVNLVSSCEELSYPWQTNPELNAEIDAMAKAAGVSVLGTGVNPGFLMDTLPVALTALSRDVRKITVLRYQDARHRRLPFQRKIGAGNTLEEFAEKKRSGVLRHVGLTESMHLIAGRMGWRLDRTEDVIEPVIAAREVSSREITVKPGMAAGVFQLGLGYVGGEEKIRLEFRACLGEEEVQDTVILEGTPPLRFTAPEGVNGDIATCAILTNSIPVVLAAPPGLRTMADLPLVSWFAGSA